MRPPRVRAVQAALVSTILLASFLLSVLAAPAGAAVAPAPAWQVTDVAAPTVLTPTLGTVGVYDAIVENVGGAATQGSFTVSVTIPHGVSIIDFRGEPEEQSPSCSVTGSGAASCVFPGPLVSGGFAMVHVRFEVTGSLTSLQSEANVSGGGARPASASPDMSLGTGSEGAPSGISLFRMNATGPAGEPVSQAAGHPNFLTTTLLFNNYLH